RSAEGEEAAGILHQLRRGSNAGSEQVQDMGELPDDYDIVVNEAISNELDMYLNDSNLQFINASTVSDSFDPDVSKWTDIDDDEVRNIILNDAEVQMKTEIWDAENKQFVEDRERKRKAREAEKGNKRRRKSVRKRVAEPGATALESTQNLLNMRRLSKKINYDVLKNLLEPDGPKPTVEPTHLSMIPSGAPSRMISVAATPIAGSGYATPTMELEYNSDSLNGLPDALAKVNGDHMDTIVIEQGKEDLAVATGTTAADIEDDDDDEEEDFEDDAGAA
ncbi:Transcription factor IIIB subunit, partial [Linderina pennispora]